MTEDIFLNQIGFFVHGNKSLAIKTHTKGCFLVYSLCDNLKVYEGNLSMPVYDKISGFYISIADFSSFEIEGDFYISFQNKKSAPFCISEKPYDNLKKSLLTFLTLSRCDYAVTDICAESFVQNVCNSVLPNSNKDNTMTPDINGGWHDMGDYGCLEDSVAIYHLLAAFLNSSADYNNNESSMPDILSECKYELEFLIKMQDKNGGIFSKSISKFNKEINYPLSDNQDIYTYKISPEATAVFAGVTAMASYIFKKYDIQFSRNLKSAALSAWAYILNFAVKNINNEFNENFSPFAFYKPSFSDKIFFAACQLFNLTKDPYFSDIIDELYLTISTTSATPKSFGGAGAVTYINMDSTYADTELVKHLKTAFISRADKLIRLSEKNSFNVAKQYDDFLTDSNDDIIDAGFVFMNAFNFSRNTTYLCAAQKQINYLCGCNPCCKCYITGFGSFPVNHPYHLQSITDDIINSITGIIVSGPNSKRNDEYSKWLIPEDTPPALCYTDNDFSFATNRTAIYRSTYFYLLLSLINNSQEMKI